jgi:flagellar biosynthetic protein FlhB
VAEQEQNRSEQATPFRLEEARRKGQVPRSLDVSSVASIALLLGVTYFAGMQLIEVIAQAFRSVLSLAGAGPLAPGALVALLSHAGRALGPDLAAILLIAVLAAVVVGLLQSGPVLSVEPLRPKLERLNPVEGFKRLFSVRAAYEIVKTLVKFVVLAGIGWLVITDLMSSVMSLAQMDPRTYFTPLILWSCRLLGALVAALMLVALIDLVFSRWEYARRLRMSRRELLEETKQREGDPRIRARLRENRREVLKRTGALSRVKDADVLITNPVHVAVALQYRRAVMPTPIVLAKGAGELASAMMTNARKHGVPIVQSPTLARMLFRAVSIDEPIPEAVFAQVARILAWVFALRAAREAR